MGVKSLYLSMKVAGNLDAPEAASIALESDDEDLEDSNLRRVKVLATPAVRLVQWVNSSTLNLGLG